MSYDIRPRVRLPRTASPGETIMIRTLATHPMETGQRRDADGARVPRHILNRFTCAFNGALVIDVEMETAISANPFLEFHAMVAESGEFVFTWHDDDGTVHTHSETIEVA